METLVLTEPGRWQLTETAEPTLPGPGEALVRVHRVGVCGTDLHAFHGRQPFFTYPRILGHELGVEVVKLGEGVHHVAPGDRCSVEPYLHCGTCIACRRGKPNCCSQLKVLGVHADGGHRGSLVLPANKLHRSASLSFDQLALVETLAIGAHAVARAALQNDDVALIIGAGPIGLATIQFAKATGARVTVLDVNSDRLAFCRDKLHVHATVDGREPDVLERIRAACGGDLPTAVLDATGNAKSMMSAFEYPAHGGRIVFVGLFSGDVTFNDPNFHRRELTLHASRNALPSDFAHVIKLMETGAVDTTPWITHRAKLAEVPGEFEKWTRPETGVLKAMIHLT